MFKQIFEIFKSDSLYKQALVECHEMLDIDLTMFKASIKSLRKSDSAEIDIDIFEMDKKSSVDIDSLEDVKEANLNFKF